MEKKSRKRIPQEGMVRAKLQKEIGSKCPFCPSEDVGHFQIHHIDENPGNNDLNNLLLVCPTYHSKITKGEISLSRVVQIKAETRDLNASIEIASISIDTASCGWLPYEVPYAFYNPNRRSGEFPILSFCLINHLPRTVLLKEIHLKAEHLYSGLSGIPFARELKPLARYKMDIPDGKKTNRLILANEIEVPPNAAFKFQILLFQEGIEQEPYPVDGRVVLDFAFIFNAGIAVSTPDICLNCKSRDEKLRLFSLS